MASYKGSKTNSSGLKNSLDDIKNMIADMAAGISEKTGIEIENVSVNKNALNNAIDDTQKAIDNANINIPVGVDIDGKQINKDIQNAVDKVESPSVDINIGVGDSKEAIKAVTEQQKAIQKQIDETNEKIKTQRDWLEHLSIIKKDWSTSGKADATAQLREATKKLVDYRRNPGDYEHIENYEEKLYVDWYKSYEEAVKKKVAQSTLSRYSTDISAYDFESAFSKLNKEYERHLQYLQEEQKALSSLQEAYIKLGKETSSANSEEDIETSIKEQEALAKGYQRVSGAIQDFKDKTNSELKDIVLKWIAQDEEIYALVKKMNERTYELTSDTGMTGEIISYGEKGSYVKLSGTRSNANFFVDENGNKIRKPRNLGEGVTRYLGSTGKSFKGSDVEDYRNELLKLLETLKETQEESTALSLISPTQEFDNEVQKNITYLENYKNTIKEIDRLKLEPETDETKKKLEELNKLAEYFISNITAIRSENQHTVSAEMMQFGGTWAPGLINKYSVNQLKELYEIAHNNFGLQTNKPFPELQYIEDELRAIEEQSESTRQSLAQDLTVSKKYARDLADNFEALVETREELSKGYVNKRDAEAYQADIDYITKKYPEILELADKIKTYGEAANFVKTEEWLDFIATLPQAHKYLESIGYDFEKINKRHSEPEIIDVDYVEVVEEDVKKEAEYFKKTDEEIYASAMELAQKRENIFEEIASREIELANKMSGEVRSAYYDMAVASNEMFKNGASDYQVQDKIIATNELIKSLQKQLNEAKDPEMIKSLNMRLDEAKVKILALQDVFDMVPGKNEDIYSTLDFDDRDIVERYARKKRELFSVGSSNYSIASHHKDYFEEITKGITDEETLAKAIENTKNELVELSLQEEVAHEKTKALNEEYEKLDGQAKHDKHDEWLDAWNKEIDIGSQYSDIERKLYNLIEMKRLWNKEAADAPEIHADWLYGEQYQEDDARYALSKEIQTIIEARKKDAEAQKEEKAVTDENTESVERNAAAIKRLTQKVRDRAKGKRWNATPEIADADFEGIISELKSAGATEDDLQKVTDIFNDWKATLPSVSNVIEETTSEIKEEASVQDKIQQETEQTIKDTKEEANAHDDNAEAIDRESEAYERALKNGKNYFDEVIRNNQKNPLAVVEDNKAEAQTHEDIADAIDKEIEKKNELAVVEDRRRKIAEDSFKKDTTQTKTDEAETNLAVIEQEAKAREHLKDAVEEEAKAKAKVPHAGESAKETAEGAEKEAKASEKVAEGMGKASKAKEKFTKANKNVAAQASTSTDLITLEGKEAEDAADKLKTLSDLVFGYTRSQRGDAATGTFSYVEALNEVTDMERKIKDGVVVSEELIVNYDKLTKKLIEADEDIIILSHRIAQAHGEEKERLEENLKILKNQRGMYQDLYDFMEGSGNYAITDEQQASFRAQRDSLRTMTENELVARQKAREEEQRKKNIASLSKEIIQSDTKLLQLDEQIAKATGERKDALQSMRGMLEAQRYEQVGKFNQNATAEDKEDLLAKRAINEEMLKNQQYAKNIVETQKEEVRADKVRTSALQEEEKTRRAIIAAKIKSGKDITEQRRSVADTEEKRKSELLHEQEISYKNIWDYEKQIAKLESDSNMDHSNEIEALRERENTEKKIYASIQAQLKGIDNTITSQQRLKELSDIRKKAELDIEEIRNRAAGKETDKANANAEKEEEAYINSIYKEREDNLNRIYELKNSNAKLDEDKLKNQSKIQANEDEIAQLEARNFDLAQQVVGTTSERVEKEERLVQLEKELADQVANTARTTSAGQFDAIEKSVKSYSKKLNDIIGDPNKDTQKYTQEYREKIETLNNSLEEISDHLKVIKDAGIDAFDPKEVEALSAEYDALVEKMDEALKGKALSENKQFAQSSLAKLRKNIEDIMARNSAMGRDFEKRFGDLKLRIDAAESVADVERLKAEIVDLEAELIAAGKTGKSAFQKFGEAVRTSSRQFIAQYFSIQDFWMYLKDGFDTVVKVDNALTELRKVSDATDERLALNFKRSTETAKELGTTISDVIGITADWSRLGYSVDDAEELARVTALFRTVGDNMTAETTSSYLISTLQGFQMSADQAMEIADKYNEVANNFAIDTAGIGEAMQRSAASFNAANTTLSESIALVTATNTVVQDPSSVGTLWKTLSARIRGAKTELEELGEDTDATTSKLQALVKGLTGFDILEEDQKTFKSIYDIIIGIGEEWNNLTDIEQASLGEALAGKRNANALYAVLNNLDTLKEAYRTAEEEAYGSAEREQENYMRSIQYSLDVLSATAQEFWTTLINSGTAKKFVDFLTQVLSFLTEITEATDGIATIGGALGIALLGHNPEIIPKVFNNILDGIPNFVSKFQRVSQIVVDMDSAVDVMYALQNGATKAADGTLILERSMFSLSAGLTSTIVPIGTLIAVLGTATAAFIAVKQAEKEFQENTEQLGSQAASTSKDIKNYKEELQGLYTKLNNSNTSYEESKTIRERLLGIQDELISKYGNEAGAIQTITDAIDGEIDALDRLAASKWQETLNEMNKPSEGILGPLKDAYITGFGQYSSKADAALGRMRSVNSMSLNINDEGNYVKNGSLLQVKKEDIELLKDLVSGYENLELEVDELTGGYYLAGNEMNQFYQDLLLLQRDVSSFGGGDQLNKFLEVTATNAKEAITTYGSFTDEYIKNEKILKSFDYSKAVDDISDAATKYKKAFTEGFEDEASQNEAIESLARVYDEAVANIDDEEVLSYIDRMYPGIKALIDKWRFQLHFEDNESEIQDALNQFEEGNNGYISYETLRDFDPSKYDKNDDRYKAAKELKRIANEAKIDYADFLVELLDKELVNDDSYNELIARYGEEAIDSLTEEELEIGLTFSKTDFANFEAFLARIRKELQETKKEAVIFDQSAFSEQVNELDALQTAYEKFRTNVNNNETKINLDIKDVDALREKFGDIEDFDFDKFELVVTSDTSGIDEIQNAFDEALTAYANYKIALEGINDENKEMIRTQLELEGATKESAQTFVDVANARAKVEEAAPELEFTSLEQMAENSALWSEEYVANLDEVYKKYNGINNIERDLIVWTDENLEKYKDFLISQYGSFEAAVEDLKGTWSTVLGDTENIQGVQIAFTQMLQTENGLVPLTKEQFWTYMDSILEASTDENGKLDVNKLIKS